jgi:pyrroline-5-carboxylate reductase
MTETLKLGIIGGGGWLGKTIIRAILQKGVYRASELGLSFRSKAPDHHQDIYVTGESQALVEKSDVILLSVRPADFDSLAINASGKLVISVMAGVSIAQIASATLSNRIMRAMPNVAASVGCSYTPWVASVDATDQDRAAVKEIFSACGMCDEVPSERVLDYLTALSGSGPAFPALLAEALEANAIAHGVAPDIAQRAVLQLLIGTGRLLEQEPVPPARIVKDFVEYRGVIAAAITAMKAAGFENTINQGLSAAVNKLATLR